MKKTFLLDRPARKLRPYRLHFLAASLFGFAAMGLTLGTAWGRLFTKENLVGPIFGVCACLFTEGWAFFLLTVWFGGPEVPNAKRTTARALFEWWLFIALLPFVAFGLVFLWAGLRQR